MIKTSGNIEWIPALIYIKRKKTNSLAEQGIHNKRKACTHTCSTKKCKKRNNVSEQALKKTYAHTINI